MPGCCNEVGTPSAHVGAEASASAKPNNTGISFATLWNLPFRRDDKQPFAPRPHQPCSDDDNGVLDFSSPFKGRLGGDGFGLVTLPIPTSEYALGLGKSNGGTSRSSP
jgi:hypothetical protein